MTDEEDNASWRRAGCRYSPLDNEALSTDEGWRPKHAVKRALAVI